jgi:DNA-binding NtrC family response regulator
MNTMKVLLVDDEEDFVTTLAERLELRGIDTQIATNGQIAIETIEVSPPDLVVLDVMMPGLGGIDVLQQIKTKHPQLPVILLTGHGSKTQGEEGIRKGAFDFLIKPLNIDELIQKIHDAMNIDINDERER